MFLAVLSSTLADFLPVNDITINADVGDDVHIQCPICTENSQSNIIWKFENELCSPRKISIYPRNWYSSEIRISNIQQIQFGRYTCSVKEMFHSFKANIHIRQIHQIHLEEKGEIMN